MHKPTSTVSGQMECTCPFDEPFHRPECPLHPLNETDIRAITEAAWTHRTYTDEDYKEFLRINPDWKP